ncbi:MAG: hypothetical protein MPW14_09105 [Candidatus Manganitrophus sp.]|nr:hypothetical protein [Candidatus Manganitrophus sp.]WDT70877.1 MAG: hypothetical protein MPW17_19355 [Candidatus Manganitrophus sp.]WDT81852.1 MAG: hypothetical protein MPW14_09105 [Candidatus Manganitrophus sp.]
MVWFWSSYEEFNDFVHPVELDNPNNFEALGWESRFENQIRLVEAVNGLRNAAENLRKMGFTKEPNKQSASRLRQAREISWSVVRLGETILLCHKRLAQSNWSEDFRDEKDLDEHWERYCSEGSPYPRIFHELKNLINASEKLLKGYDDFLTKDRGFLIEKLDLPDELQDDFILSNNLLSVGFDEVGVLIAGRGLERVLREIARSKKINVLHKNRSLPAEDADSYDLIEALYRVRWQKDNSRLIDSETTLLLHLLRTVRNQGAHPTPTSPLREKNAREMASIITRTSNSLWKEITQRQDQFINSTITKDW